MDKTEFPIFL